MAIKRFALWAGDMAEGPLRALGTAFTPEEIIGIIAERARPRGPTDYRKVWPIWVQAWAWDGRVQPLTERYLLCLSRYLKREDIARGADLREAGADIAAAVRTRDWVFPK